MDFRSLVFRFIDLAISFFLCEGPGSHKAVFRGRYESPNVFFFYGKSCDGGMAVGLLFSVPLTIKVCAALLSRITSLVIP